MHKHATDYTKPLLADFERNVTVLESVKIPNFLPDFERNAAALESVKIPNFLPDFERNAAALESVKIPNFLPDFERNAAALESVKIPNFLPDLQRNRAALEGIKIPNFVADFQRNRAALESIKIPNFVADFQRNAAALESIKIPNFVADLQRNRAALESIKIPNFVADLQRNLAAFEGIKSPNLLANLERNRAAFESVKIPDLLAALEHNAATVEEAKEHRDNYVETDYNRDLAHGSTEEPNHAIEDYNEVIISNLESIFGDGLAFSEGNKEIPSNIPSNITIINVRQITIGPITQGEKIEMKSEVSNSQVGVLNTGKMQAKSMTTNITTLADPSQHQIAEALTSLAEAVKASQNISSQQQIEILEQLELLREQATLAPSERKVGLIKPILSTLATTFSAGGGLAEIWSQWGNVIKEFFGIQG